MFVSAQAASNYNTKIKKIVQIHTRTAIAPNNKWSDGYHTWSCGYSALMRNSIKRGTTPDWITSWIGGLRSVIKFKTQTLLFYIMIIKRSNLQQTSDCLKIILSPIDSNFRNWVVASSCMLLSSDQTPAIIPGRFSSCSNQCEVNKTTKKIVASQSQHYIKSMYLQYQNTIIWQNIT